MQRVCFLFNHDQTHQVAHSLPIALRMAEMPGFEVTLAVTNDTLADYVTRAAGKQAAQLKITQIGLKRGLSQALARGLEAVVPARKILIYRDNLEFFRSFDALVVSEKTSLLLRTRYGLNDLKLIHTRHGAGDRDIGFGAESAKFDLVLVAGPKIARRLIEDTGVEPSRIRMTGYSKFDLCAENNTVPAFPDPSRPTVLYNPHPSPRLSSWFTMGTKVLDAFFKQDRYNLIFAPHVMMFARQWTVTIQPPSIRKMTPPAKRFCDAEHIHIDLGSTASSDMTYTNIADLYLGDVSSQVYEFLHRPRPCLHLDAHHADWQDDPAYLHWRAGPVVGPEADVLESVDAAFASHQSYLPAQHDLLADTFSVTDTPASQRAAIAIRDFLTDE